ncbi:tannase and feruloyl esterase-domain-containing protein [Copromyces sp. CBS 386.78]|nr:tannase and feruloyl esterase-domain-containing protein [Copromyces sp. CBS 386.78]
MDREWADSHIASHPKSRLSYLSTAMLAVAFSAVLYALLISNSLAELGGGSLRQRQTPRCLTSSFTNVVNLPGVTVTIEKAVSIAERGSYAESGNQGFPQTIDMLPALCAVTVRVTNTSDFPDKPVSSYRVAPPLLAVSNWPGMSEGTHYGFVAISTDNGHNSAGSDLSWATPARLHGWGYRALHGSVVVGKLLIAHYYSNSPTYSYYAGCSTGGRQGLREVQYDANSFDGVLIGAPAWDTMHLMPWISKIAARRLNTTTNGRLHATLHSSPSSPRRSYANVTPKTASKTTSSASPTNAALTSPRSSAPTPPAASPARKPIRPAKSVYNSFTLSSEDQWSVYFGTDAALTDFDFSSERYFLYNLSSSTLYTW